MMKEIWFIRHGESESNAGFATPLPRKIALTGKGFEQARRVPEVFGDAPDLIITSPFVRAKQTAEPTIERFAGVEIAEWDVHEFNFLAREKNVNTTKEARRPFIDEFWRRGEAEYSDGGGAETFAGFMARVKTQLGEIFALRQKRTAIFTHRQFIASTLWLLLNEFPAIDDAAMKRYYNFINAVTVPNAAIFKIYGGETSGDFRFSSISTRHLPPELITV